MIGWLCLTYILGAISGVVLALAVAHLDAPRG